MQIVIDMDEEDYKRIQDTPDVFNSLTSRTYSTIRNGTPLPKGHGRLIDADALKDLYDERISCLYALNKKDNPSRESNICATNWCNNMVDELPTIIETYKSESEVQDAYSN